MILFLKKIFFFFLYISLIIYLLTIDWVPYNKKSTYIYAAYDKQRLIEENKNPKVYFTGGSGLALGLDTKRIINETKLNCINLGLNGGLGAEYYLNQLIYSAKENDIVFIVFEYGLPVKGYGELLGDISDLPFVNLSIKQFLDYKKNCYYRNYRYYFENKWVEDALWSREGFNDLGDFIDHWGKPNKLIEAQEYIINYLDYIERLNTFYKIMSEKSIKVYFLYPPLRKSFYAISREHFDEYIPRFEKKVKIPILGSVEENIYPDSLFFDSEYHLNIQGINKYTSFIISKLKMYK